MITETETRSCGATTDEVMHLVCSCQVDATPRLSLCGWDCSDDPEGRSDSVCLVCRDLTYDYLANNRACERCR